MHREDGVELEADRPGLDVAHAGEENGGEQFGIRGAGLDFFRDAFQEPVARGGFQQADKRLDLGPEPDLVGAEAGFGGGQAREAAEETGIPQGEGGAGEGGRLEETAAVGEGGHGAIE